MLFKSATSAILLFTSIAFHPINSEARTDTHVKSHIRRGTAPVQPHKRKAPNKTKLDNYGTKGNLNPSTGKIGKDDLFTGKGERR